MKVADLSKKELRTLIEEVVEEKLRKLVDPDCGLELREDFVARLETSISSKRRIPFEEVKKSLNLS
mgnify:CR=1 FL=1